jgi:hypothetical protein
VRVPVTTNSESAAQPRALSIESLLEPRDVTPKQDAAPIPAKDTELDAAALSTTNTEIAPDAFRAPDAIEALEDQNPIEAPVDSLPLPELRAVSVTGAAANDALTHGAANSKLALNFDRPANVARYYIVGRPEAGGDIGRMAQRDLDEAAVDAHVTAGDNGEEQAMYVDADGHFATAGRKPRGISPEQIERRRNYYGKVLAEDPNQPAHEADDVDALIALMLADRLSYTPFVYMINGLKHDVRTGRTDLPTLKNCMLRNWRAVHGVGAPGRMAA